MGFDEAVVDQDRVLIGLLVKPKQTLCQREDDPISVQMEFVGLVLRHLDLRAMSFWLFAPDRERTTGRRCSGWSSREECCRAQKSRDGRVQGNTNRRSM